MNIPKSIFRLLFGKRLPTVAGTLQVGGVHGEVLIRRDQYGIAYIEAGNDEDAWFGLGFCQGQDRAFQLEQIIRIARGALAELVGPDGLPFDRVARRLGFHRLSVQQLKVLDADTRRDLDAFARGVTQGMRIGCQKLAHEFTLLGVKQPSEYRAVDVLSRIRIMGFALASNWDTELVRMKILSEDGPEALRALEPNYPEWLPVTNEPLAKAGAAGERLAEDLAAFQKLTGSAGGGSNNWALAAARTATGRPLLANDPHLAPLLPSHWYLTHVRTPEWAIAGPSFIGTPLFAIGHNGFAAWGVTAGLIDNTDLFVEEIGTDGQSVREGDDFVPCETVREVINVKGDEPVEEQVLLTRRGPIVGPALEGEVGALSMRATWLDVRPVDGWFKLHHTQGFEEFRRYFESFPALPLNVAYADTSGTIGWQLAGDAPRRRKGWGLLPASGSDPEAGWEAELLPFDALPYVANPEVGFVASANNQPAVSDAEPFLGIDWLDGYRFARIVEALQSRTDWDVNSTRALQLDQLCLPWREMREIVLAAPVATPETEQALALLQDWDGVSAADSPAAAVFELFVAEMVRRVVEAKAPQAARWALGQGFAALEPFTSVAARRVGQLVRLLRESPPDWFARPWAEEIADALAQSVRTLKEKRGPAPENWGWGHVRPLTLQHPVGERKPLDKVFNLGPFPWGGNANTVAQCTSPLSDPTGDPYFIASLRMVIDVGNWDACSFVLPGGQSGNPLSPHYGDLLPLWRRGEGVPIAWSPEAVAQATQTTLHLIPAA